ncbi:flavin reductase family protein [Nocardioides sp. J54]|uniref:flavin reductase family protein n=1 Tax=Nocardioides sp. J54 TaxID=935866 RepID=UPI000491CA49|nr:flavin reductase family protein [Nocardioides sp. J54]
MTISQADFKAVMASAAGPATVVTAMAADGTPRGLTMSAVCSVSLDPPMVLACLDRGSTTLAAIRETGSFTVNYLRHGCEDVALAFATKSDDKFTGRAWERSASGAGGPVLLGCNAAHAVCVVAALVEAGDHVIAVGEVEEGCARDEHPVLAYARRQFFAASA